MSAPNPYVPCPICATPFRRSSSPKQKKTCGAKACTSELHSRSAPKAENPTPQALRGRARRLKPLLACERCGHDGSRYSLERHHKDRDIRNNVVGNIEVLCQSCHAREHITPERVAYLREIAKRPRPRGFRRTAKRRKAG